MENVFETNSFKTIENFTQLLTDANDKNKKLEEKVEELTQEVEEIKELAHEAGFRMSVMLMMVEKYSAKYNDKEIDDMKFTSEEKAKYLLEFMEAYPKAKVHIYEMFGDADEAKKLKKEDQLNSIVRAAAKLKRFHNQ